MLPRLPSAGTTVFARGDFQQILRLDVCELRHVAPGPDLWHQGPLNHLDGGKPATARQGTKCPVPGGFLFRACPSLGLRARSGAQTAAGRVFSQETTSPGAPGRTISTWVDPGLLPRNKKSPASLEADQAPVHVRCSPDGFILSKQKNLARCQAFVVR
jgi:hypothetical protein